MRRHGDVTDIHRHVCQDDARENDRGRMPERDRK